MSVSELNPNINFSSFNIKETIHIIFMNFVPLFDISYISLRIMQEMYTTHPSVSTYE